MTPVTDYKQHDIEVDANGMFCAAGIDKKYPTMKEIMEAIDIAAQIKYEAIPAFTLNTDRFAREPQGVNECLVTRPHGHESRKEFCIKYPDGKRKTTRAVYNDTPENRTTANLILEKTREVRRIDSEINSLQGALTSNFDLKRITK